MWIRILSEGYAIIAMVLMAVNVQQAQAQAPATLAIDGTKPIIYIEFDHAGPRQPVTDGEPSRGLWLRLVNNSVVPILVRANGASTDEKMTILSSIITPRRRAIPKSGPITEKMPSGYSSDTGTLLTINPGEFLVFSVPENYVTRYWYMEVPFQFSLPPVKRGVQPTCLVPFVWENIPPEKAGR